MPVQGTCSAARPFAVRLDFAELLALQHPQTGHAVGDAALMQLLQPRTLLRGWWRPPACRTLRKGTPCSWQKRFIEAAPATQLRAFSDPVL